MADSAVDAADTGTEAPPANWTLHVTSVANMATRATFLSVFLILGVVGNCVLVATIAQSNRLKGRVLNLYIISIAIVNLIDCFGNMPLILGSTIKQQWDYGQIACQINAFGLNLASMTMIFGLMLMTLDRFLGVKNPEKHADGLQVSVTKANICIVYSWIQAAGLCFPLLINAVPVALFYNRYLCSIKHGAPLVYLVFISVIGYIVSVFLTLGFDIYIIIKTVREKLKQRKRPNDFNGSNSSISRLQTEVNAAKYVAVLFVLWCIFEGPYLLLSAIQQYRASIDIDFDFSVPWQVELAFTWMRLSYPIYLPIITLGWQKEVWQKFKNCILCRKSNLILDASPKSTPDHKKGNNGDASKKDTTVLSDGVPVLFATENGIHIQHYGQDDYSDSEMNDDYKLDGNGFPSVVKKCDVMGSQVQMDEDTSDYDSSGEIDPFSSSNPISVRTEYGRTRESIRLNSKSGSLRDDEPPPADLIDTGDAPPPEGDIVEDAPTFQMVVEAKASPVMSKKKKKKKKKEVPVDAPIPEAADDDNDVDPSARYRDDRTSHDSGRGSMEDRSKKRKEKRAAREELERQEQEHSYAYSNNCETNIDDPLDHQVSYDSKHGGEKAVDSVRAPEVEQPRVKKKKKKKKFLKAAAEDSVEMTESLPAGDAGGDVIPIKDVGDRRRPLPLKPLEVERSGTISSKPLNPPPKLPAVAVRSHARRTSDQPRDTRDRSSPEDSPTHPLSHHRSYSESQLPLEKAGEPQRPIPAKRSKSKTSLAESEPKPKPRLHKRAGTTDSQTHLLSSSNTSTDLSEINNYINREESDSQQQSRMFTPAKAKRRTKTSSDQSRELTLDSDVSPR